MIKALKLAFEAFVHAMKRRYTEVVAISDLGGRHHLTPTKAGFELKPEGKLTIVGFEVRRWDGETSKLSVDKIYMTKGDSLVVNQEMFLRV